MDGFVLFLIWAVVIVGIGGLIYAVTPKPPPHQAKGTPQLRIEALEDEEE